MDVKNWNTAQKTPLMSPKIEDRRVRNSYGPAGLRENPDSAAFGSGPERKTCWMICGKRRWSEAGTPPRKSSFFSRPRTKDSRWRRIWSGFTLVSFSFWEEEKEKVSPTRNKSPCEPSKRYRWKSPIKSQIEQIKKSPMTILGSNLIPWAIFVPTTILG